jgi:Holliday junction DNA helicase RuvA
MIAQLTGTVAALADDHVVVDVQGVGYLVQASRSTLTRLGGRGVAVMLLIETHVREDRISLFGFASAAEREWFRHLTTVQGVGPKVALSILSTLPIDALLTALAAADVKAFTRADGVGPKLAQRLVTELKGKAGAVAFTPALAEVVSGGVLGDAVSALVNLGYGRAEAFSAVSKVKSSLGERADISALIKAGLKELAA